VVRRRAGLGAYPPPAAQEEREGPPHKEAAAGPPSEAEVNRRAGLGTPSRAGVPAAQEERGGAPVARHLRVAAAAAVKMGEHPMVRQWRLHRMPCVSLRISGMLLRLPCVALGPCFASATPPRMAAAAPSRAWSTLIARAGSSTIQGYPAQTGRHGLTRWPMSAGPAWQTRPFHTPAALVVEPLVGRMAPPRDSVALAVPCSPRELRVDQEDGWEFVQVLCASTEAYGGRRAYGCRPCARPQGKMAHKTTVHRIGGLSACGMTSPQQLLAGGTSGLLVGVWDERPSKQTGPW